MKGKKVLKVLVAAITVTMLLAQVVAMADGSYTTSTTYDLSSGKALVTTTVSGVAQGDEVTFLVTDNDEIIYIDQMNTNDYNGTGSESAQFRFLTDVSHANGTASVNVGSSTEGKLANPGTPNNTIILSKGTVTYSVTGEGDVYVGDATSAATTGSEQAYPNETITFYFAPAAGYELSAVKVDDVAQGGVTAANSSYTYTVTGNAALEFVFAESQAVAVPAITDSANGNDTAYAATITDADPDNNAMTSFATVTNPGAAKEFGIIVSKNQSALEAVTDVSGLTSGKTQTVRKFTAYGSVEGKFGVKLVDGGEGYLTGTVYSRAYVADASGACAFGDTVTHTY